MRVAAAVVVGLIALSLGLQKVTQAQVHSQTISPTTIQEVRDWDNTINRMLRSNELQVRLEREDTVIPGRTIQQLDQYYKGVLVFGAGLSRQLQGPIALSIFGMLYDGIDIDVIPKITQHEARDIISHDQTVELGDGRQAQLVILPLESDFRLAWIMEVTTISDRLRVYVDAITGDVFRRDSTLESQLPSSSYVGHGRGVLGDDKKISTAPLGGGFVAYDTIRPPEISTLDLRSNLSRWIQLQNGIVPLGNSDYASTASSNEWTDGAVVDAHVYSSYTYDYYFKRFGRRGLDNNNISILNVTHVVRRSEVLLHPELLGTYWAQALYLQNGVMFYGEGLDFAIDLFGVGSQRWNYLAGGLDVVAHELTHGVTQYTSGLLYQNESGALNESFSDIMGTSVEFFFQPPGNGPMHADYLCGEDVVTAATTGALNGLRSLENPRLYGQPDHLNSPLRKPSVVIPTSANDDGGVHTNSGIPNHVFYLAIEGGTNRTSGIRVTGVGAGNREQIERVFYRAFAQLMPRNANFAMARAITLQAAQDLYGVNSPPYNAVRDAWTAVGVN